MEQPEPSWSDLEALVGLDLGRSGWVRISQDEVDRHADGTGDAQWIHNDPERARREGPFGGPIVQGFLLLAHFTELSAQLDLSMLRPVSMLVNYGFDRVRFVGPVVVDAPIALTAKLASVRPRDDGSAIISLDCSIVTQMPEERLAVAARWLFLASR